MFLKRLEKDKERKMFLFKDFGFQAEYENVCARARATVSCYNDSELLFESATREGLTL